MSDTTLRDGARAVKRPNRTCETCGTSFYARPCRVAAGSARFCSSKCYGVALSKIVGPDHPKWKGGRHVNRDGYVVIRVGPKKQRLEHRVLKERELGRPLRREEVIHHANERKTDNRLENLDLTTQAEHVRHHRRHLSWSRPCSACGAVTKHYCKGMCRPCYERSYRERRKQPNAVI